MITPWRSGRFRDLFFASLILSGCIAALWWAGIFDGWRGADPKPLPTAFTPVRVGDITRSSVLSALQQPVAYPQGNLLSYEAPDGTTKEITTPEEFITLMASGWEPRHRLDEAMMAQPHKEAGRLLFLLMTAPAAVSEDPLDISDLSNYPAAWGPWVEGPGPAEHENFQEYFAHSLSEFEFDVEHSQKLQMSDFLGKDFTFKLVAMGDYNLDGIEDYLMWFQWGWTRGRDRGSSYMILSGASNRPRKILANSYDRDFWFIH